ncbi:hypothetical protein [Streptomyces sp. DK15]|nr:hypothetical protein [Streptomyces sp. DK15]
MKTIVDWPAFPVALLTLLTGLLALGSNWGLVRHRWIYTKFWLTLAMIVGTFFGFRDAIVHTYTDVTAGHPLADAGDVLLGPMVSLTSYVFMVTLSILKPWGLTKRGRKQRAVSRGAVDDTQVVPLEAPGGASVGSAGLAWRRAWWSATTHSTPPPSGRRKTASGMKRRVLGSSQSPMNWTIPSRSSAGSSTRAPS